MKRLKQNEYRNQLQNQIKYKELIDKGIANESQAIKMNYPDINVF